MIPTDLTLSDRSVAPGTTGDPPSPLGLKKTRGLFLRADPREDVDDDSKIG